MKIDFNLQQGSQKTNLQAPELSSTFTKGYKTNRLPPKVGKHGVL